MEPSSKSLQRLVTVILGVALVSGLVVVVLDRQEILRVLREADWRLLPLALSFVLVSYGALGYGFAVVNRLLGIRLKLRDLWELGVVSSALNYILSTGGVAGYSLRFVLMNQQGVSLADIAAASLLHSYVSSLALLGILPAGLIYLAIRHPLGPGAARGISVAAGLLAVLFVLGALLIVQRAWRRALLGWLGRLWYRLRKRSIEAALTEFDDAMTRGVTAMMGKPLAALALLALVVTDWAATVVSLGICFDALGQPIGPGVLVTGFAIGVTAGLVSMIPGGLGVQEGSMAGVYHLLGVPLQQAVLASILFRVVYYFVPFFLSLPSYWRILRTSREVGPTG